MGVPLSVCVEMLFRDLPFLERLDRVAETGAPAFEFWRWAEKDLPAVAERARRLGLRCAGLVGSGGGPLVDPARRRDFVDGVRASIQAARTVGATTLIATTGQALAGVERAAQHASIVEGLRASASLAEDAGMTLVLEPLNTLVDHAGYYLDTTAEGAQIVDAVGSPAVKLLFDAYHAAVMGEEIVAEVRAHVGRVGHVHVAGAPGRHELGRGQLDYRAFFDALAASGYEGYVGLEFRPTGDHAEAVAGALALAI
jgi:hydroxypyruvate isomerase